MVTNLHRTGIGYICTIRNMSFSIHQKYMHRCIQLARKGAGNVAPNPLVGALLVYDNRIIGEGWHQKYGEAHAEVNCINDALVHPSVSEASISSSTLYVSLEPCAHYGKTPPCTDLIIKHKIAKVVIGCRDPFPAVNGKGIEKLQAAGVEVVVDVLEKECKELNKRFFTFHTRQRPFVILKWAQTADGFIAHSNLLQPGEGTLGSSSEDRLYISNEYTNRFVHKWRSEEAAILVGTNTALLDNPALTTRIWPGPSPVRAVLDTNLRLPTSLHLFDQSVKTIVFNSIKNAAEGNLIFYKIEKRNIVRQLLAGLYKMNIQSVLVEGGAALLQSFIDEGLWDEARVIAGKNITIGKGVVAPLLASPTLQEQITITGDELSIWVNKPGHKN
jgi:diaminohydroxyphosphoribosylaminopyrimidine deaminase / 5-amino-6-(5-phosphoribosylamino)uracil reductase